MKNLIVILALSLCSELVVAQNDPEELQIGNSGIRFSIFENATTVSLNYEYLISLNDGIKWSFGTGIGVVDEFSISLNLWGGSSRSSSNNSFLVSLPVFTTFVFSDNDSYNFFELGFGGSFVLGEKGSENYFLTYPMVAYRRYNKRNKGGYFRIMIHNPYSNKKFTPLVLPVGIAFGVN